MPATVPGFLGVLIPNLVSTGMIGTGLPKYARGVALGLQQWVPQVKITTIDTGTAGAGKNVPLPIIVPQPILYTNLIAGMVSQKLTGVFMPSFIAGLANGLVLCFTQTLISTTHPSVGVGGGVAKFSAVPAAQSMISGFAQAGMVGDQAVKKAKALATGLDRTFAILIMPVVIAGPPSPFPSAGSGFGSLI
jgi:hypothetical protein